MRTRSLRLVLLALVGALLLAGCGDDSGVGDEPDGEASAPATSTTEAEDGQPAGGDDEQFCQDIQDVTDELEAAGGEDAPEQTPEESVAFLRDIADQIGEIEPPAAIEDEFEVYAGLTDELATALEGIDPSDDAAADGVLTEFAREHADDFEDGQRVADYIEEECGIDFANPIG